MGTYFEPLASKPQLAECSTRSFYVPQHLKSLLTYILAYEYMEQTNHITKGQISLSLEVIPEISTLQRLNI